ncbi:MAG: response regulator [Planctomycetota bacterium]
MSRVPRVLLVDDETLVLSSLQRILRLEPYDIATAGGGAEALEYLEREGADLVLSDYKMPGMNGVEFLRRVAERHPGVVRMMLTAHADPVELEAALASGLVQRAFRKPWDNRALREAITAGLAAAAS